MPDIPIENPIPAPLEPIPFLDPIIVDGSVTAIEFIGSGAQLTDIPQNATLNGFNSVAGGVVLETDTVQEAIEKLEYKIENFSGGPGGGDLTYTHTQIIASDFWTIAHTLDKYPSVTVIDSGNNIIVGDVHYTSTSQLEVSFTSIFSGKAILN